MLSAVRQAHCELSAVRQDFGVTLRQDFGVSAQSNAQGGDAVPEPAEGQSNAHCELSENIVVLGYKGAQHCQEPM